MTGRRARGLPGHAPCRHRAPIHRRYERHWADGSYHCICCGARLFDSGTKFDAGCSWPSFRWPARRHPGKSRTGSHGMARRDGMCTMRAHLGHVPDGPAPTGLRYCMNSASLAFEPRRHETAHRFFPIILFFVAFQGLGASTYTGVAIVATIAQIAYIHCASARSEPMQWLSLGVIVLFGGATLLAQSETLHQMEAHCAVLAHGWSIARRPAAVSQELHPVADGCANPSCPRPCGSSSTGPGPVFQRHGRAQPVGGLQLWTPTPGSTSSCLAAWA